MGCCGKWFIESFVLFCFYCAICARIEKKKRKERKKGKKNKVLWRDWNSNCGNNGMVHLLLVQEKENQNSKKTVSRNFGKSQTEMNAIKEKLLSQFTLYGCFF